MNTTVILYRIDPEKGMQRYYRMDVQPDLFGRWCLIREWGRIGRRPDPQHPLPYPAGSRGRARQAARGEGAKGVCGAQA